MSFVRALQNNFFTFLMVQNIFFAKDDYYILKNNSISEQKNDYIYSPKQTQETYQRTTTPKKPNDILFDSIYALKNTVHGIIAKNEELSMKISKQKENYEKLSLNFASVLEENKVFHEEIKKLKSITEKQNKEISELKQDLEKIINDSKKAQQKETVKAKPQTDKEFIESIKKLIKGRYFTKSIEMLTDFIKKSPKSIYLGQAFFYRGISYMLKSDITNASKDFVESYTKNPKSSVAKHALWFLSECLKKQGKHRESRIILQKLKLDYPKYEEEKFKF